MFVVYLDSMLIATGKISLVVPMLMEQFAVGVSENPIPFVVFQLAELLRLSLPVALAAAACFTGWRAYFSSSPKTVNIGPC